MRLGSICNHRGQLPGGTHSLFSFCGRNAISNQVIWAVRRFFGDSFLDDDQGGTWLRAQYVPPSIAIAAVVSWSDCNCQTYQTLGVVSLLWTLDRVGATPTYVPFRDDERAPRFVAPVLPHLTVHLICGEDLYKFPSRLTTPQGGSALYCQPFIYLSWTDRCSRLEVALGYYI